MMQIHFYFEGVKKPKDFKVKSFRAWVKIIEEHYPITIKDLSYIFIDDEQLLEINQKFLQHDTYTDIITFDLSETKDNISGEIYISLDRIKENAVKFNVLVLDELLRVVAHGLLHLIGFNDKTKKQKDIMTEQENICIELFRTI